jgi:hypothetical protein
VTDESSNSSSTLYTITGLATPQEVSTGVYSWSFDVKDGTEYQTVSSGKQYLYTATVTAYDANGNSSEATRRVHIDTKKPDVSITAVTPTVKRSDGETCVNGTVTVTGTVSETNFGTAALTVSDGTDENATSVTYAVSYNFTEYIDTTAFRNNKTLTLTLTATDKAGNVSEPVTQTYTIDQSTDEPVITLSNASTKIQTADSIYNAYTNSASVTNIFGTTSNNKLLGTVTDDDGIASVSIAYDTSATGQYEKTIYENEAIGGTTSFTLTDASFSTLPEGLYYLKITVADTKQATSHATYAGSYFAVAVDNGGPSFSSVTPANGGYYSSSKTLTVSGTVTDGSGSVTITMNSGNGTGNPLVSLKSGSTTAFTLADTVTPPGTDGSYAVVYTATDRYGQASSYEIDYMVDTTAPSILPLSTTSNFTKTTTKSVEVYVSDQCWTDGNPYLSAVTSGIATVSYAITYVDGSETKSGNSGTLNYYSKYTGSPTDNINTYYSIYKGTIILTDGVANTITYTITDNAGNSVTYKDPSTYTVDATAPDITINDEKNSISMTSTSTDDILFTVVAADNKSIDNLTISGITGSVTKDTDYTITETDTLPTSITKVIKILGTSAKHDGTWSFTLNAADSAGWTAETRTITAQVDSHKPTITVNDTAARNIVYNVPQSYSGTMSDNIGVTGVYYIVQTDSTAPTYDSSSSSWKSASIDTASSGETEGKWSVTANLSSYSSDTPLYIFFAAKDALGNAAVSSAGAKVTLDRDPPKVEITAPNSTTTSKDNVTVSGTVKEANLASLTVTATKNGSTATSPKTFTDSEISALSTGSAKNWSFTLPAKDDHSNDGTWVFTITAADKAGQTASKTSVSILIDTTAPTIVSENIKTDESIYETNSYLSTANNNFTLTGTIKDLDSTNNAGSGATKLYYRWGTSGNYTSISLSSITNGTYIVTIPVTEGTGQTLSLYAEDSLENTGSGSPVTINRIAIDYAKPVINITTSPLSLVKKGGTISVAGTITESDGMPGVGTYGVTLSLSKDGTAESFTVDPTIGTDGKSFSASYTTGTGDDGTWRLSVAATDKAGRTADGKLYTSIVDATAPAVTVPDSGSSWLRSAAQTLSVTATDTGGSGVAKVTYKIGSSGTETAMTAEGSGTYTATLTLPQGTSTVYVYGTDDASNTSEAKTVTYRVDTEKPVIGLDSYSSVMNASVINKNSGKIHLSGTVTDSLAMNTTEQSGNTGYGVTITATKDGTDKTLTASDITYTLSGIQVSYSVNIPSAGNDGTWVITVAASDASGYAAESKKYDITVDATAPSITQTVTHDEYFKKSVPETFSGTMSNDVSSVKYIIQLSTATAPAAGNSGWKSVSIDTSTTWSSTVNMNSTSYSANTPYTAYFMATDTAGNTTISSDTVSFILDSAAPVLSAVTASATISKVAVTVSGTVTEKNLKNLVVTATQNGTDKETFYTFDETTYPKLSDLSTGSAANWSFTLPAKDDHSNDGTWVFAITAEDKAGQTASKTSASILIDTTAPAWVNDDSNTFKIGGKTYSTDNWYNDTSLSFTGYYKETAYGSGITTIYYWINPDGSTIILNDTSAASGSITPNTANGDACKFTATISGFTSNSANNEIYFAALDEAGNIITSTDSYKVQIDSTAPTVTSSSTDTILTNAKSAVTVTGTVDGGASGVDTTSITATKGSISYTDTSSKTPTFTLTLSTTDLSGLNTGINVINTTVKDGAGNSYTGSIATIQKDTTAPTVTITSPTESSTVNKTITVTGTASDTQKFAHATLWISTSYDSSSSSWTDYTQLLYNTNGTDNSSKMSNDSNGYLAISDNSWSYVIDTTKYNNTTTANTVAIKIIGTDAAGNTNTLDIVRTVSINQNADRPVIKLTNLKTSDSTLTSGTVYGSVTDDDGTIAAADFYISEDSSTWYNVNSTSTPVTYSSGSWTYTLSTATQGTRYLYFKVIDDIGTSFTSNETSDLDKPYVRGTSYISPSTDQSTFVTYTLDTNPPTISSVQITKTGGTSQDLVNNIKFGKNNPTFTLSIVAKDTSGIKSISAQFGSLSSVSQTMNSTGSDSVTATLSMTAPTTDKLCETEDLVVTVVDENSSKTLFTRTVIVDNADPSITVVSPTTGTQVTGDVEVRGTASDGTDGTGVSSVKWYIPDTATVSSWSTMTSTVKDACFTNTLDGTASWSISFTSGNAGKLSNFFYSTTDTGGTVTWHNSPSAESTLTYGTSVSDGVWSLPVYFRIEDEAGNITYSTSYYVNVNPDGDRPTSTITYPETGAILGGTIRVFGTAEDNESVGSVHMEIQKETYTDGALSGSFASISTAYDNVTVTGTTSWNYTIDGTSSTFAPPGTYVSGGTNTYASTADYYNKSIIRIRTWALDNNSLKGSYTDWVLITIDKNAPRIGSTNPIKLVQYDTDGTTVSASQTYTSGMYISGTWYLTCSVEDENGIQTVETQSSTVTKTTDDAAATLTLDTGTSGTITTGTTGYNIKIKVETAGTGNIKFNIYALDNSTPNQYSSQAVYLKFDNTAPVQTDLYHSSTLVGLGTDSSTVSVVQENYTYLVNSTVTETGSGLERTAVYFKRTKKSDSTSDIRIYDPRFEQTSGTDTRYNRIDIDDSTVKADSTCNYLPYCEYTSVSRSGSGSFTLSAADKFIEKGSLVRIAGVYRLIDSVSSDGLTMTFSPEDTTLSTTVDVVYALIVDNTKYETLTNGVVGGDGDDGDGIYDYVSDDGSSYSWKMAFDSQNIPDGPLSICYVSFDEAGNASNLKTVATKVENNKPRIAKVFLGTDLDGSGTITDGTSSTLNEMVSYSTLTYNETEGKYEAPSTVSIDALSSFTAKDMTEVIPEIVGGNGDLHYTWDYYTRTSSDWGEKQTGSSTLATLSTSADSVPINGESTATKKGLITLTVSSEKLGGLISDGEAKLEYTFWDSTDETDPGTTSLSATLSVAMKVDVVDGVAPKAVIDPFYWNSSTDNSLYSNLSTNGHIELPDDLKKVKDADGNDVFTSGATDKEYDLDPKVSGKISIRGSAYDDQRITALWMHIDDFTFPVDDNDNTAPTATDFGFEANGTKTTAASKDTYYKVASFNNNKWTGSGIALDSTTPATYGWYFTVTPDYLDQNGHHVTWQLDIDTSKIKNVAGLNKQIRIIAEDRRSVPNASSETAATTDADVSAYNNPLYQVDVVPYIAKLTTKLSSLKSNNPSVYDRTALGHYPVSSAESITITGFNLTGTGTSVTSSYDTESQSMASLESGEFSLTVGGATTLNNKNNNNAVGNYSGTYTDNTYAYCYNREPNGDNNELLNDDVYLDVWQFNSEAAKPVSGMIEQPVMKINPSTGIIGFAFVNGPLYFSMGGTVSGTDYSSIYWMGSYDFFTSIGFTYDSLGYSYGCAAGGDINSTSADKFELMSSRWGISGTGQTGSYSNTNSLRLESIGQKDSSGTRIFNKQRIKSPSLATAVHGDNTNLYLAYYDDMNEEIRFKAGSTDGSNQSISTAEPIEYVDTKDNNWKYGHIRLPVSQTFFTDGSQVIFCDKNKNATSNTTVYTAYNVNHSNSSTDWWFTLKNNGTEVSQFPSYDADNTSTHCAADTYVKITWSTTFGSFIDYDTNGDSYFYRNGTVSMIAGSNTGHTAGEYVSIATTTKSSTDDSDVVVAVWYDATKRCLWYTYNTTPTTNRNGVTDGTGWSSPIRVFSASSDMVNAGEYCQIIADKSGGIHIAAYDPNNLDLDYAYLASYTNTAPETCIVDGSGVVGSNITLDVAKSNGIWIPYIGYYATSCVKPKYAYKVDTSNAPAGSVDEEFTGKWEITVIPTTEILTMGSLGNNKINVGIWKDADSWVLTSPSTTDGSNSSSHIGTTYGATCWDKCYGNGTTNPVLGYAIKNGTSGAIETAQKK